jgi:sugar (pentulose or hexulose) kinase
LPLPVIAIFDVGKTNKKICLFNEQYELVYESAVQFSEITDENGEPCEDVERLISWIRETLSILQHSDKFHVRAVNFSAYGASLVYIDESGRVLTPLYNYLKKYPASLTQQLYSRYGGEEKFCLETASPALGSLNSGLQLYRVSKERPEVFRKIKYALHLPQFLSFLVVGQAYSDITSIGCHTALWDFSKDDYHEWVRQENLEQLLAPILPSSTAIACHAQNGHFISGVGMHDSSAALIPYLLTFREPFVLISTGTWSISLNPFNQSPLTNEELKQDCLCNLSFEGVPVKTARMFAGFEHDQQVKRISEHFNKSTSYYKELLFNALMASKLKIALPGSLPFANRELSVFEDYESAYHQLMLELIQRQQGSTQLVLNNTNVKRIFVDGGFSQNLIYMHLLADAFRELEVYAASVPQASALGAALAIHEHWNKENSYKHLVELKHYPARKDIVAS